MKTDIIYRRILRRIKSVSDESFRENQKTHFILHIFSRKSYHLWANVGKCGWAEHAPGDNIAEPRNGAVCKGKNRDTRS